MIMVQFCKKQQCFNNVGMMLDLFCNNLTTMLQIPQSVAASLYFRLYGEIFFWLEVLKFSIKVKSWGELNRFYVTTVNATGLHKLSIKRKKNTLFFWRCRRCRLSAGLQSGSANGSSWNKRLVELRRHQTEVVITPSSLLLSDNRPTVPDSASHTRHLGWEWEKMMEHFGILFVEKKTTSANSEASY